MGLFDSLDIRCPNCRALLEFQSKSGACCMYNYTKSNLPPEVAVGLDGDIVQCQYCNKNIKLICKIPKVVKVKLVVTKKKFNYPGNYNPKHPDSTKRQKELHKFFKGELK